MSNRQQRDHRGPLSCGKPVGERSVVNGYQWDSNPFVTRCFALRRAVGNAQYWVRFLGDECLRAAISWLMPSDWTRLLRPSNRFTLGKGFFAVAAGKRLALLASVTDERVHTRPSANNLLREIELAVMMANAESWAGVSPAHMGVAVAHLCVFAEFGPDVVLLSSWTLRPAFPMQARLQSLSVPNFAQILSDFLHGLYILSGYNFTHGGLNCESSYAIDFIDGVHRGVLTSLRGCDAQSPPSHPVTSHLSPLTLSPSHPLTLSPLTSHPLHICRSRKTSIQIDSHRYTSNSHL